MVRRAGDDGGVRSVREPLQLRSARMRVMLVMSFTIFGLPVAWWQAWEHAPVYKFFGFGYSSGTCYLTPTRAVDVDDRDSIRPDERVSRPIPKSFVMWRIECGHTRSLIGDRFPLGLRLRSAVFCPAATQSPGVGKQYWWSSGPTVLFEGDLSGPRVQIVANMDEVIRSHRAPELIGTIRAATNDLRKDVDAELPYWPGILYLALLVVPLGLLSAGMPFVCYFAVRTERRTARWTSGKCPMCGYRKGADRFAVCSECGVRVVPTNECGA